MENVIKQMAEIVEKRVKYYKDDFYKYDIETIAEHKDNNCIFIVRECGTWLLSVKDLKGNECKQSIYTFCYDENATSKSRIKPHKFYRIDIKKGTVKPFKNAVKLSEIIA